MATFTNQATLSYNGGTTLSNVAVGELTQVLSVDKSTASQSYRVGDIVTYVINLQNSGTTPFTGLTLTDNLGAYTVGTGGTTATPLTFIDEPVLLYVNGVQQTAPTAAGGPPLTLTGVNIPAGANATIIYRARVNDAASPLDGGVIDNTVTVTGAGVSTGLTALSSLSADTSPLLSISKGISPIPVVENGQVTYTFTVFNNGVTEATDTDALTVTDTFDPILTNISVELNGTPLTENTDYTYNQATGLFTTTAGTITVPAATATQDGATGEFTTTPGTATLTVTGTI